MPFRSLRSQLTVSYVVILALALSAFGTLTYALVRYQLLAHHDAALREAATEVASVLSGRPDSERLTASQRTRLDQIGQIILFRQGQGRAFYRSPDATSLPPRFSSRQPTASTPERGGFETVPGPLNPMRVYSQAWRSGVGRRGVIRVVHSLGDVPAPLASLRLALFVTAPLAALLSAAVGYWLAGRALGPVDQVTRIAREIEASHLSRRLPTPKAADEIGRLVDTFNQMIGRLEASFEGMKRFTADAAHELRGPLATMRGAIDVAMAHERESREYRDVLASVGEDVEHLRSVAEDLLVLARADAGAIRLEKSPVRLDVVLGETVASLQSAAAGRGVSLTTAGQEPVLVLGDERWLRQLALNLLDNALKFSETASQLDRPASVLVEVAARGGSAVVSVIDTGPGIPEEELGRIFERFYRGDRARGGGGVEGSGLGLAIAAWIVEAHGGEITARNRPEAGSVFSVTFPLVG